MGSGFAGVNGLIACSGPGSASDLVHRVLTTSLWTASEWPGVACLARAVAASAHPSETPHRGGGTTDPEPPAQAQDRRSEHRVARESVPKGWAGSVPTGTRDGDSSAFPPCPSLPLGGRLWGR